MTAGFDRDKNELDLFTPIFNHLSFEAMLAELRRYPQIQ
jgi:hypothetical protein